jgi:hypothetical protein
MRKRKDNDTMKSLDKIATLDDLTEKYGLNLPELLEMFCDIGLFELDEENAYRLTQTGRILFHDPKDPEDMERVTAKLSREFDISVEEAYAVLVEHGCFDRVSGNATEPGTPDYDEYKHVAADVAIDLLEAVNDGDAADLMRAAANANNAMRDIINDAARHGVSEPY